MIKISFVLADGEEIALHRNAEGTWCCPVCGSAELQEQPYYPEGGAYFEMCGVCGFEFGFDDTPLACSEAISGIQKNWKRWRAKLLEGVRFNQSQYDKLAEQLNNIGVSSD